MPLAAPVIIGYAGLAVAAYGAYEQYEARGDASDAAAQAAAAQRVAAGAQRERADLEARRADIANARQLRTAVRQARVAEAVVRNTGANAGTSASSGVLGGAGSVVSQGRANVGFFGQMQDINQDVLITQRTESDARIAAGQAQGEVYQAEANAGQWGALANLGGTIFTGAGGFKTIFDGPPKT